MSATTHPTDLLPGSFMNTAHDTVFRCLEYEFSRAGRVQQLVAKHAIQVIIIGSVMVVAGLTALSMPLWLHRVMTDDAEPLLNIFMTVLFFGTFTLAMASGAKSSYQDPTGTRFRRVYQLGSFGTILLSLAALASWLF